MARNQCMISVMYPYNSSARFKNRTQHSKKSNYPKLGCLLRENFLRTRPSFETTGSWSGHTDISYSDSVNLKSKMYSLDEF